MHRGIHRGVAGAVYRSIRFSLLPEVRAGEGETKERREGIRIGCPDRTSKARESHMGGANVTGSNPARAIRMMLHP